MEIEQWKDITGFEGLYQISNYGRARSLDRIMNGKSGSKVLRKGILLRLQLTPNGYHIIGMKRAQVHTAGVIHLLVWDHFNGLNRTGMHVDHIDNNPRNNNISNLQLLTPRENTIKSILHRGKNLGVHKVPNGKWSSKIYINGVSHYLGRFDTKEEASAAYHEKLKLV